MKVIITGATGMAGKGLCTKRLPKQILIVASIEQLARQ